VFFFCFYLLLKNVHKEIWGTSHPHIRENHGTHNLIYYTYMLTLKV